MKAILFAILIAFIGFTIGAVTAINDGKSSDEIRELNHRRCASPLFLNFGDPAKCRENWDKENLGQKDTL